jgi:AraC-like DNA-binding protein
MAAVPDRVIRHASELGRWEMVGAAPDRRLRPHVRGYWGYDERTIAFSRRRELATVDAVLIVGFGEPIEVAFPRLGESVRATAFVSGLSDCYAVVDSFGHQRGVQVDLTPLGAFLLVGIPMRELANRAVVLEDLLGGDGAQLPERLHDARGWPERFELIDALLFARFAAACPASPDASWAWKRLRETGGRVAVSELATELGCSRRHLTTRFGEEVGLPPKTVARLLRFGRAARLLGSSHWSERPDRPRLGEVALACGYYDQAHLNRDFREFAGVTPTELQTMLLPDHGGIAEACSWPETAPQFPSVQDPGAVSA